MPLVKVTRIVGKYIVVKHILSCYLCCYFTSLLFSSHLLNVMVGFSALNKSIAVCIIKYLSSILSLIQLYLQVDSNHHLKFRKLLFYPLNYEGKCRQAIAYPLVWFILLFSVQSFKFSVCHIIYHRLISKEHYIM